MKDIHETQPTIKAESKRHKLSLDELNNDVLLEIGSKLEPLDLSRLSLTSKRFHGLFAQRLKQHHTLTRLMLAVVDGDKQIVERILNNHSHLLLLKQQQLVYYFPKGIQSRFTWQRFYPETPLAMALKRNQVEMVKILLPHYKKHYDTSQLEDIWQDAEAARQKQQQKTTVFDFSLVVSAILSTQELATPPARRYNIINFRDSLLPKEVIKLDQYYDIHELLLLAYRTYHDECQHHNLQHLQRLQFCIIVIGFLQSLLPPEDAKVLCTGLGCGQKNKKPLNKELQYLLRCQKPFYRASYLDSDGMGFGYFATCEGYASMLPVSNGSSPPISGRFGGSLIFHGCSQPQILTKRFFESKSQSLSRLKKSALSQDRAYHCIIS